MIVSQWNALEELVFFIRNSDILTTTERGVTTTPEAGTFASDSTHLINDPQIKNIRSIIVASETLAFGVDYTYDTDFDDVGTKKTKITFTVAQTGAYTISYDTGTDKIFPDFPKSGLSLSSYPRIAVDMISTASTPLGFGNKKVAIITDILFTTVAYANKTKKVRLLIADIKSKIMNAQTDFFYFKITLPQGEGRIQISNNTKNEIFQSNLDFISTTNVETKE